MDKYTMGICKICKNYKPLKNDICFNCTNDKLNKIFNDNDIIDFFKGKWNNEEI